MMSGHDKSEEQSKLKDETALLLMRHGLSSIIKKIVSLVLTQTQFDALKLLVEYDKSEAAEKIIPNIKDTDQLKVLAAVLRNGHEPESALDFAGEVMEAGSRVSSRRNYTCQFQTLELGYEVGFANQVTNVNQLEAVKLFHGLPKHKQIALEIITLVLTPIQLEVLKLLVKHEKHDVANKIIPQIKSEDQLKALTAVIRNGHEPESALAFTGGVKDMVAGAPNYGNYTYQFQALELGHEVEFANQITSRSVLEATKLFNRFEKNKFFALKITTMDLLEVLKVVKVTGVELEEVLEFTASTTCKDGSATQQFKALCMGIPPRVAMECTDLTEFAEKPMSNVLFKLFRDILEPFFERSQQRIDGVLQQPILDPILANIQTYLVCGDSMTFGEIFSTGNHMECLRYFTTPKTSSLWPKIHGNPSLVPDSPLSLASSPALSSSSSEDNLDLGAGAVVALGEGSGSEEREPGSFTPGGECGEEGAENAGPEIGSGRWTRCRRLMPISTCCII